MRTIFENFNILVVEDNPSDLFLLEEMLRASPLEFKQLFSTTRLEEAKKILHKEEISVVLLDLSLPDSFGMDTLKSIRKANQRIPIIILTGLSDSEAALTALQQGAQDYLVKGEFTEGLLVKSIEYSIERKKIEENILLSEEKYRQMFYRNPFPMWINEVDTLRILEVNDAAIEKYGYSKDEFLQLTLNDIQVRQVTVSETAASNTKREVWEHRDKTGNVIVVEFTYYPINYFGRSAMQAQANDITQNIKLQRELAQQKQQLVDAVLSAQENERRVIGRELHDNVNQILTALKLNLDLAFDNKELAHKFIDNSRNHVSLAMDEIRKLSKELIVPGNLKELGLMLPIQDLLKETLQYSPINWRVQTEGVDEFSLSQEQKLAIYRIIQEQVTNILKHAEATTVIIQLYARNGQVLLKITDNGKGFNTNQPRSGIGITNITSRAESFNGYVKIDSVPGAGCTLEVVLNSKEPTQPQASQILTDSVFN